MPRSKLVIPAGAVAVAIVAAVAFGYSEVSGGSGQARNSAELGRVASGNPAAGAGAGGSAKTTGSGAAGLAGGPAGQAAGGRRNDAIVRSLNPAQLAGQRVIYSYTGLTPPASLLTLIAHGEAAGVIFFSGNITSQAQLAGVVRTLDKANASTTNPVRRPLLLMTDQEGGLVRRLSWGRPTLSEKQIGAAADPQAAATRAGTGAAATLRAAGLNVNLAPVLDVYRQPGNFIDEFQRSYSMDPHVVSKAGAAFVTAQQQGGVAATVKHFPGLGAAARSQNTDVRPVTLNLPAATIRSVDEFPYKAAIAALVKLVMVSWAVYPSLDAKFPAGLSSKIIKGELRQRLGFTGVTITDAIEAGALRSFGSNSNRSVLAADAGMDLLLCADGQVRQGRDTVTALEAAYSNSTLGHGDFQAAVQRILALRASLPR